MSAQYDHVGRGQSAGRHQVGDWRQYVLGADRRSTVLKYNQE